MIYRDCTFHPTKDASARFLQALAVMKPKIVANFSLNNGFLPAQANKYELFFRLEFNSKDQLDGFHKMGMVTAEIDLNGAPKI